MQTRPNIAIIGTAGIPANYGGFETLADHLVRNLSNDYRFTVYCSARRYPKHTRQAWHAGARLRYLPLDANGMQSILYDALSILHALWYADVLLVLGVAGAWMFPFVRYFTRKKIIVSIDGIEWKREKWGKLAQWYLFWAEGMAVKYSHLDISDNEAIQDYTARHYNSLSRLVEYGADHTLAVKLTPADRSRYPFADRPYAFGVCRIEPENNVHLVLEAFAGLPRHHLVMVGNWNNSPYGQALRSQYATTPNLTLLDPIYDQRQLDALRGNALVYIHGHAAGGTNPSLVEAMYLGLPVMAYGVSYNRKTTEGKAFYFRDVASLQDLIRQVPVKDLKATGAVLQQIAARRYTWAKVAAIYGQLFQEALTTDRKTAVLPSAQVLEESRLIALNLGHLKHQQAFHENR